MQDESYEWSDSVKDIQGGCGVRIYSDTKVYVMAPSNEHTGGIELLHQLASQIIALGIEAYMFYYPIVEEPVDEFYKKYHVPFVTSVEDSSHNILVVNETVTQFLYITRNMQRVLWWLSVDFYLHNMASNFYMYTKKNATMEPMMQCFVFTNQPEDIEHWVQSEYARQFVKLNLGDKADIKVVGDYLNLEFLQEDADDLPPAKKNVIVYNPKKGLDYTRKLMAIASDLTWIPIENMTPQEVRQCLMQAKVYVDFGDHPGKDRIPREAAISGCVVITGMRGGAANDIDVGIGHEFKFDEKICQLSEIAGKIRFVMDNYEEEFAKQEAYRCVIRGERDKFSLEVAEALGISIRSENVALITMPDECDRLIAALHKYKRRLLAHYIVNDELAVGRNFQHECVICEHNVNYLSLPGTGSLECITWAEAAFLYREGRISLFAGLESKIGQGKDICNTLGICGRDLLLVE